MYGTRRALEQLRLNRSWASLEMPKDLTARLLGGLSCSQWRRPLQGEAPGVRPCLQCCVKAVCKEWCADVQRRETDCKCDARRECTCRARWCCRLVVDGFTPVCPGGAADVIYDLVHSRLPIVVAPSHQGGALTSVRPCGGMNFSTSSPQGSESAYRCVCVCVCVTTNQSVCWQRTKCRRTAELSTDPYYYWRYVSNQSS